MVSSFPTTPPLLVTKNQVLLPSWVGRISIGDATIGQFLEKRLRPSGNKLPSREALFLATISDIESTIIASGAGVGEQLTTSLEDQIGCLVRLVRLEATEAQSYSLLVEGTLIIIYVRTLSITKSA